MKILFVAAECSPLAKVGGLGDVIGSLPPALRTFGHDVRVMIPKYKEIKTSMFLQKRKISVPIGSQIVRAKIWKTFIGRNTPVYLIDCPQYYNRNGIYGSSGSEHSDNDERYIFLCKSIFETLKVIRFNPDIIHVHDWHTGLIPMYLSHQYKREKLFNKTATVLTIHNISYQGIFSRSILKKIGIKSQLIHPKSFSSKGLFSFLKTGLLYSNVLSTVSPSYAKQIMREKQYGSGMEDVLKSTKNEFFGILNGLDMKFWNPALDPLIFEKYTSLNLDGKRKCKRNLQESLGLEVSHDTPLVGMVTRIDHQKGIDFALDIMKRLLNRQLQFVILGQGDRALMRRIKEMAHKNRGKMAFEFNFNEPLAHKIYSGADIFLMPSRFEPCGLSQLIAMRYGTLPVVTPTGGLLDTVKPIRWPQRKNYVSSGSGFVAKGIDRLSCQKSLQFALDMYAHRSTWEIVSKRVMKYDFSWNKRVREYVRLYRRARQKSTQ